MKCPKCNKVQTYERIRERKVICQSCGELLPEKKGKQIFGMKDSIGMVR